MEIPGYCGKTLEGICEQHGATNGSLYNKLKQLKDQEIIEKNIL
jgi:hypothetical protein